MSGIQSGRGGHRSNGASWVAVATVVVGVVIAYGAVLVQHGIAEEVGPVERKLEKATFAGGCFWCMEPPFDKLEGVVSTTVGYTGGDEKDPTYEAVSAGMTGHAEAIEIVYDPAKVRYETLLEVFWRNVDPTTPNRQFCDVGAQYRTAVFYHGEAQKKAAEASKAKLAGAAGLGGAAVVTEVVVAGPFYPAEEYHQNYYVKNPLRYKYYRWGCGRDERLREIWGKSPDGEN